MMLCSLVGTLQYSEEHATSFSYCENGGIELLQIDECVPICMVPLLFSSPPPEVEMQEHRRSRRDMSPQGRKRAAVMTSRDKMVSYQPQRKVSGSPPQSRVLCGLVLLNQINCLVQYRIH
jgi:hypothetical protein